MSIIKTWKERIQEKFGTHWTTAIEYEMDVIPMRDAEITELREALKVAHIEIVNRNQRALDGDKIVRRVNELCGEVEALQAKLSAIEAQEPLLKVYRGDICYLSQEDDQSFNMWCPVSPAYPTTLPDGTELYAAPVAPAQPLTKEQVEKVLGALETIRYSMIQAQIPGNDRLREIKLSLGTAREAIEIMKGVMG